MNREKLGPAALIVAGVVLASVSATVLAVTLLPQPAPPDPSSPAAVSPPSTPAPSIVAARPVDPSPVASSTPAPPPTDPAAVPGAYEAAGYWWVPCESPFAIRPQEFEYGCAIAGHEPAAGTLLAAPSPQPTAAASDVALGAELLEAWIPYDSADPEAWRASIARIAPGIELPQVPALAWSTKAGEFADEGFHAVVEFDAEPQLIATTAEADGTHLSYSAPVTATYSIDRRCLPDDVTADADDRCILATLSEPLLWTLVVHDGQVLLLHEPDPFATP